jgi:hypothetical protein
VQQDLRHELTDALLHSVLKDVPLCHPPVFSVVKNTVGRG